MFRYIVIYKEVIESKKHAILTLLRSLSNAGSIIIDTAFNGILTDRWIYRFTVSDSATEDLLIYLCETCMLDYRTELCAQTLEKVLESGRQDADLYRLNRKAFAIVDGIIKWQPDSMKYIATIDWLTYGCFVYGTELERIIRGSISKGKVKLYCGRNFDIPEECDVRSSWLIELVSKHAEIYKEKTACIELGAVPGEDGVEWPAREVLGLFLAPNFDSIG